MTETRYGRRSRTQRRDRRRFLQALLSVAAGVTTGCARDRAPPAQGKRSIVWAANAGECDPADIQRFERQSLIHVDYREVIADADQFFASVKPELVFGLPVGYDLVCIATNYVQTYVDGGWLERIPPADVPNVHANMLPWLKAMDHLEYAIPFDIAPIGVAFDRTRFTADVESWGQLLDPAVRGRVGLYTMPIVNIAAWGLYLRSMGKIDNLPSKMTFAEAMTVLSFLRPHIRSGQLLVSQGEDAGEKLSSGDLVAAVAPPVNIFQMDPKQFGYLIPKEGAPLYVDRLGIPKHAANPDGAMAFINWWFTSVHGASFSQYTLQYPFALHVQEELAKTDASLAHNPLIFPDHATLERLFPYTPSWSQGERATIGRTWTEIISG